jgi:hypothetical protein
LGFTPTLGQSGVATKLDTTIPLAHQARYQMNPNYVAIVKKNLDNLLNATFITLVEEASYLSPIIVVPKTNGKFSICVDFR